MLTRRQWLLSTPAIAGAKALHAEPAQHRLVKAGPFSIQCPKEWADGAVVEKVPVNPLYTHEQWLAFQANPANQLKPGYSTRPAHWAIRVPKLAKADSVPLEMYGDWEAAPQVLIHQTSGWADILETGEPTQAARNAKTADLRNQHNKLLAHEQFRLPLFADGALDFLALKRQLKFTSGNGVRMLAQRCYEHSLLWERHLQYFYFGMSDDDSCYVIATFPLSLEGLPSAGQKNTSHLGYSFNDYDRLAREHETDCTFALKWLEERQEQIEPKLAALDAMMESLRAVTWE